MPQTCSEARRVSSQSTLQSFQQARRPSYRQSKGKKKGPGGNCTMAVKTRRTSVVVDVGGVKVGGDHPIAVQSMTNTDTADVTGTANQGMALARAGSELVRPPVTPEGAAPAVPKIAATLEKFGV